jgi:hypothetical protein
MYVRLRHRLRRARHRQKTSKKSNPAMPGCFSIIFSVFFLKPQHISRYVSDYLKKASEIETKVDTPSSSTQSRDSPFVDYRRWAF